MACLVKLIPSVNRADRLHDCQTNIWNDCCSKLHITTFKFMWNIAKPKTRSKMNNTKLKHWKMVDALLSALYTILLKSHRQESERLPQFPFFFFMYGGGGGGLCWNHHFCLVCPCVWLCPADFLWTAQLFITKFVHFWWIMSHGILISSNCLL